MTQEPHIPVLLKEVLGYLDCRSGGLFIDGTFGAGGYTRAMLNANPGVHVIGFDRDPNTLGTADQMMTDFNGRFTFIHDCFGNMAQHVRNQVDGIVLDLGVSSMQIDQPERGFSFRSEGPLDMRMAQRGISAQEVVNSFPEQEIAHILFRYGEEKASYRIAAAVVQARQKAPITTTAQLADIIHRVMPRPKDGSDSAMRSFQALRIFVNDELGELERALKASIDLLKPSGRLVVVSFHSLEDRLVKNFLIHHSALRPHNNRHAMTEMTEEPILFEVLTKKPIVAGEEELACNPRAHSAKLRAARRRQEAIS